MAVSRLMWKLICANSHKISNAQTNLAAVAFCGITIFLLTYTRLWSFKNARKPILAFTCDSSLSSLDKFVVKLTPKWISNVLAVDIEINGLKDLGNFFSLFKRLVGLSTDCSPGWITFLSGEGYVWLLGQSMVLHTHKKERRR